MLLPEAQNPQTEETIFCLMKQHLENLDKAKTQIKELSNLTVEETLFIIRNKQAIFSGKYTFAPLVDLMKEHKFTNPPLWDFLCLVVSIDFFKGYNIHIKSHRKKRVTKTRNLDYRVNMCYAEIKILRQKNTPWKDIIKFLRKHHRALFKDYALTVSYLRRVYIKVNSERMHSDGQRKASAGTNKPRQEQETSDSPWDED